MNLGIKNKNKIFYPIYKNDYTWTASTGYKITGTCASTCTAASISLTGTVATAGTTCSITSFGNQLFTSHATTITFNKVSMILSSIVGLFLAIHL
jgi:hypothetical protein